MGMSLVLQVFKPKYLTNENFDQMKSEEIAKMIIIHPKEDMNVCLHWE